MNINLEKKKDFEKDFATVMNISVFGKTMENMRKYRDTKLVRIEQRRNDLVSEPNYHTTKFFTEHLLAIKWKEQRYLLMYLSN